MQGCGKDSMLPAATTCKHIGAMNARPTATGIRREMRVGIVTLGP